MNAIIPNHHDQRRTGFPCVEKTGGRSCRMPAKAVIALGGGGARGIAHLGCMEAIGEAGVQTERIVGVSIGSLVGALYAAEQDIHAAKAKAIRLLSSPIFSKKCQQILGTSVTELGDETSARSNQYDAGWFTRWYVRFERVLRNGHRLGKMIRGPAILENDLLIEVIERLLPDIQLEELAIPLSVVAVDLVSGRQVVLERGSLRKAVLASMSIPAFFPPVAWGEMALSDIGVLDSVPTMVARSYHSDWTIAVDVSGSMRPIKSFGSAFDVLMRMEEIGEKLCRDSSRMTTDLTIRPHVGERPWYDFSSPDELISAGLSEGRAALHRYDSISALG